jgi:hypothetical protein
MLLVLTSSGDVTADYLTSKLATSAVPYARLDTDTCVTTARVSYDGDSPTLAIDGVELRPADIRTVLLRRPKEIRVDIVGDTTERIHVANEWSEAIEGFLAHVPIERWMNHPTRNVLASHKLEQLTRARNAGLSVPPTLVTQSREELDRFWTVHDGHVVAKPLASGYLERPDQTVSSIYTNRVLARHLDAAPLAPCPTLFQAEVQKAFDVRVTVIDDRMTAVGMRRRVDGEQIVDIRRDNMQDVDYVRVTMPEDVVTALRTLLVSYGLRFAAVDFAITPSGEWVFFEINPNGQWAWMDLTGATALWQDFVYAFAA